jgi:hypothetical protein
MKHNNNYISFLSKGEKIFSCQFDISKKEEILVFVDNNKVVINEDYNVEDMNKDIKKVVFNIPVGSLEEPSVVLLKRNIDIIRISNFSDSSQIRSDILNKELDNIINQQIYLKDTLDKVIQGADNIILPLYQEGKSLIWSKDGNLINSIYSVDIACKTHKEDYNALNIKLDLLEQKNTNIDGILSYYNIMYQNIDQDLRIIKQNIESIDLVLDSLLYFVNNHDDTNNGSSSEINTIASRNVTYFLSNFNFNNVKEALDYILVNFINSSTIVESRHVKINNDKINASNLHDALDIISSAKGISYYIENFSFTNIKEALDYSLTNLLSLINSNSIVESRHVKINNNNINASNLQDGLDIICKAQGIYYDNTNTDLKNVNNVQDAIVCINNKVLDCNSNISNINKDLRNLDNLINSDSYKGSLQSIISGRLNDKQGLSEHILFDKPFSLVVSALNCPLKIAFSFNNSLYIGSLNSNVSLNFSSANIYYYIYADLDSNNQVSIGYMNKRPVYQHHNPIYYPSSSNFLVDNYLDKGDFFHIPSMTMFNSNNQAIKRVYIGQVCFNNDGSILYLNNYCHGDSFSCDIGFSGGEIFTVKNLIGHQVIFKEMFFKYNRTVYEERKNYSMNITSLKANSDNLQAGMNWVVSDQDIWVKHLILPNSGGSPFAHILYKGIGSNNAGTYTNNGWVRIYAKRAF